MSQTTARRTGTATGTGSGSGSGTAVRAIAVGLVVVGAAMIGTFTLRSSPSAAAPLVNPPPAATSRDDAAVTEDDGLLPDGVTVFDDEYPGVANLGPDLRTALREATTDAARDGITLHVNSGWRSRNYQDQLLREAVSEYGSERNAARWVATADSSPHVSGDAVDIGPDAAAAWLSKHGARYGLCQIYRNEPWHFELRPAAMDRGCPRMYADPAHDPRMEK